MAIFSTISSAGGYDPSKYTTTVVEKIVTSNGGSTATSTVQTINGAGLLYQFGVMHYGVTIPPLVDIYVDGTLYYSGRSASTLVQYTGIIHNDLIYETGRKTVVRGDATIGTGAAVVVLSPSSSRPYTGQAEYCDWIPEVIPFNTSLRLDLTSNNYGQNFVSRVMYATKI